MIRKILLSILLFLYATIGVRAETVQISTGHTPPMASSAAPYQGYLSHVISVAFEQVDIYTEFVFLPWSRAYKEAKEGAFVATSYWYQDQKHLPYFYPSNAITYDRVVFFKRKSHFDVQGLADIKRKRLRLGLTRGYTYTEELWRYAGQNPAVVSVVNTDMQNFKMLLMGRIDVFVADEISGWYALNHNFSPELVQTITTVDKELFSQKGHLMFSKAHPDAQRLLQLFNRGLELAEERGLLEKLQEDFITGKYREPKD